MVTFLESFLLGISLTLPLGPVTLEILRRGINLGYMHSLKTALGAFAAELTYFTLVYLGLSKLSESPIVKYTLGLLGVGFLLYLGFGNIKDYFSKADSFSKAMLNKNSFAAGFLITFLNPLNFIMWVGIIGLFFTQSSSFFINTGVLYGIFLSLVIMTLLSLIGNKLIKGNNLKYISLIAGLFLVFYAINLLYSLIVAGS